MPTVTLGSTPRPGVARATGGLQAMADAGGVFHPLRGPGVNLLSDGVSE